MRHGSLFSGIGGFDLAAEWMGWQNIFHCEWNDFGKQVLKYYWPESISYHDITKTDFTIHRGKIDILTGGFPCQPYSQAGKRLGKEDERHLWPEMLRAIREIAPTWVVGENVRGLVNWSEGLVFHEVQADLEAEGYEVQPFLLPACAVNAPHRRDRIWFIAYSDKCNDRRTAGQNATTGRKERLPKRNEVRQSVKSSEIFGLVADTENSRCGRREDKECQICEREFFQGKQRRCQVGSETPRYCRKWLAANSTSIRLCEYSSTEQSQLEAFGTFDRMDTKIATNSTSTRRKEDNRIGKSRFNDQKGASSYWANFPTQSPICGGNDGLPTELDRITFSKWRNESIKAYGNAIVPQVALQIFKAISEYNFLTNKTEEQ